MNKSIISATLLLAALSAAAADHNKNKIDLDGYVGSRIDDCIHTRILGQDVDHITEPFTHKNDTASWQTEFWGKWVQGAIASYRYNHDKALYDKISHSIDQIIASQQPDGYIGNYAPEYHLAQWDVWGRKYTALGLLAWHKLTGDKKALDATARLIDHLMTEVGPGHTDIVTVGNYHGMAASSVLEPVIYLYNATGNKKYLDFANYIVSQWETPEGPQLVSKALKGIDVASRFPHPSDWFSPENGQKAYEMMSCYVGLLELYKITGNPTYLDAVEKTVANIVDKEINVAGSGSSFESWYHGKDFQALPTYHTMETCVTFTWMQLCDKLLEVTGKPFYADQIEKTLYNALMASLKDDASQIAKYSPIEGHRFEGEEQCGLHINCCNANGPRGFALIPSFAVKSTDKGINFNYYGDMTATADVNGNTVSISQKSDYPATNTSTIEINPEKKKNFSVNLRIPVWSANTVVKVNGKAVDNVSPGSYLALTREWAKGDKIEVAFDMPVIVTEHDNLQTVTRGPIVFARDSRFDDGFVDESAVIMEENGTISDARISDAGSFAWITIDVPVTVGANLEGTDAERFVKFCDFASAGNTWSPDVRYRVWIPKTLNIKLKRNY